VLVWRLRRVKRLRHASCWSIADDDEDDDDDDDDDDDESLGYKGSDSGTGNEVFVGATWSCYPPCVDWIKKL
jgi:hypothetical protein